ncbi:MAG: SAM-dependent methyltransferase [Pseudanabaena sp.]|nr:MAG: SAM-dependent methyltransferase [Pseudanabaena sp.]
MSVFGNYASYYDLIYRDKDYEGESQFIHRLIQTHGPNALNILELGCGTGNHAALLAKNGYQIYGVDFSEEMLSKARRRLAELPLELASKLKFYQGDIRKIRLNQTFDAVLSLFHVISYQTTNEDLLETFVTVKKHLKPGGIFIFNVWYGPAVLTEKPEVRIKQMENEEIIVTRIAEPVIHPNENLVDVNYQITIRDKTSNAVEEMHETHRMRYLFKPEINLLLNEFGLNLIDSLEWMTGCEVGFNTWDVCFIATI